MLFDEELLLSVSVCLVAPWAGNSMNVLPMSFSFSFAMKSKTA